MGLRYPFLALFLLSFLQLALEIHVFQTIQFLYDYLAALLWLGLAMTAVGAGGGIAYAAKSRIASYTFEMLTLFPLTIVILIIGILELSALKIFFLIFATAPFLLSSILIALFFQEQPSQQVYGTVLLGAAAGLAFSSLTLASLREENGFLLMAILGFLLPALTSSPSRGTTWIRRASLVFVSLLILFLAANLAYNYLNFAKDIRRADPAYRDKIFSDAWRPNRILHSKGSVIDRIDTFSWISPPEPKTIFVAFNGVPNDHVLPTRTKDLRGDRRLPHGLIPNPHILILGLSGEGITKAAKAIFKGSPITGIEINPAIVNLMRRELWEASDRAYDGIRVHVTDARTFLRQSSEKFDIITLMNTHRVKDVGQTGQPEYLHTEQAFEAYLSHLTDRGFLILEERNENVRGDITILKIIRTAMSAMKKMGVDHPEKHIVVYNYYAAAYQQQRKLRRHFYTMIALHRRPLQESELSFYQAWAGTMNHQRSLLFRNQNPVFFSYLPHETLGTGLEKFILDPAQVPGLSDYDLSVITDDRPFPSKIYKTEMAIRRLLIFVGTGFFSLVLFALTRPEFRPGDASIRSWTGVLYFTLIGFGYMLFEITLLQKYQLPLGSPLAVFLVVLGSLFLFSSVSGFFLGSLIKTPRQWLMIGGGLILLPFFYQFFLPVFSAISSGWAAPLRIAASCLSLAPLGLILGIPFPRGLETFAGPSSRSLQSYFYGLNGAASGLGTVAAMDLAAHFGFSVCLFLAGTSYGIAVLLKFAVREQAIETRH